MPYLVTVSSQGQITIPVRVRENLKAKKYYLEAKGGNIILRPARIFVPLEAQKQKEKKQAIVNLSKEEKIIYDFIKSKMYSSDELLYVSGIEISKFMSTLTFLEMKNLIRKNAYMRWEAIG
jgi:bifunctional DNA-binding transcriptional regulator/antitoxin component of YhaV-PrlF toxin-antitoxin module